MAHGLLDMADVAMAPAELFHATVARLDLEAMRPRRADQPDARDLGQHAWPVARQAGAIFAAYRNDVIGHRSYLGRDYTKETTIRASDPAPATLPQRAPADMRNAG